MSGISSAVPPIKFDSNGNVLANVNAANILYLDSNGNIYANLRAQSITPNAVASNVKTDANGNVLANINAQSITPTATASNIKTDANGNVLANLNAQNIQPTIANPYAPQLLSHQTGLSATISTANTYVNLGTSITVPRNGIVKIILMGYQSAGTAYWRLTLTRGTTTHVVQDESGNVSWGNGSTQTSSTFVSQSRVNSGNSILVIELLCLANDVLQLQGTNNVNGGSVYADDLVVILQ